MIGTHDSYTYLKAKNKLLEKLSFLWRTQTISIAEQKALGVKYFDVRIRRDKDKWRVCHGLVDFDLTFKTIKGILSKFPVSKVRIILERGNKKDENLFTQEINSCKNNKNLSFSCIKKGWKIVVWAESYVFKDYSYIPWHSGWTFWANLTYCNFFSTIKRNAKKNNPAVTKEMKEDGKTVYFMDYVC